MTQKHGHHQSGEPSGQVKNEGVKNFSHESEMTKNVKDLRGGAFQIFLLYFYGDN